MNKVIRDCENYLEVLRQIQQQGWDEYIEAFDNHTGGYLDMSGYDRSRDALEERIDTVAYMNSLFPPRESEGRPDMIDCLHCHGASGSTMKGSRGLCKRCYLVQEIRRRYPVKAIHLPKPECTPINLPTEPCPHPPGSTEKVEALIERMARGEQLWHPQDTKMDPEEGNDG